MAIDLGVMKEIPYVYLQAYKSLFKSIEFDKKLIKDGTFVAILNTLTDFNESFDFVTCFSNSKFYQCFAEDNGLATLTEFFQMLLQKDSEQILSYLCLCVDITLSIYQKFPDIFENFNNQRIFERIANFFTNKVFSTIWTFFFRLLVDDQVPLSKYVIDCLASIVCSPKVHNDVKFSILQQISQIERIYVNIETIGVDSITKFLYDGIYENHECFNMFLEIAKEASKEFHPAAKKINIFLFPQLNNTKIQDEIYQFLLCLVSEYSIDSINFDDENYLKYISNLDLQDLKQYIENEKAFSLLLSILDINRSEYVSEDIFKALLKLDFSKFIDHFKKNLFPSLIGCLLEKLLDDNYRYILFLLIDPSNKNLKRSFEAIDPIHFLSENIYNAEYISRFFSLIKRIGPCTRILDEWIINQPGDSPIFSADYREYVIPDSPSDPFPIPSLAFFYGIEKTTSPYNLYLLGKYGVPVALKLGKTISNIAEIAERFCTRSLFNYIIDNCVKYVPALIPGSTNNPVFEFFPSSNAFIYPKDNFQSVSFYIKFPKLPGEFTPFLYFNGVSLGVKKNEIVIDNDTAVGYINENKWTNVILNMGSDSSSVNLYIEGALQNIFKFVELHFEGFGSKTEFKWKYYIYKEILASTTPMQFAEIILYSFNTEIEYGFDYQTSGTVGLALSCPFKEYMKDIESVFSLFSQSTSSEMNDIMFSVLRQLLGGLKNLNLWKKFLDCILTHPELCSVTRLMYHVYDSLNQGFFVEILEYIFTNTTLWSTVSKEVLSEFLKLLNNFIKTHINEIDLNELNRRKIHLKILTLSSFLKGTSVEKMLVNTFSQFIIDKKPIKMVLSMNMMNYSISIHDNAIEKYVMLSLRSFDLQALYVNEVFDRLKPDQLIDFSIIAPEEIGLRCLTTFLEGSVDLINSRIGSLTVAVKRFAKNEGLWLSLFSLLSDTKIEMTTTEITKVKRSAFLLPIASLVTGVDSKDEFPFRNLVISAFTHTSFNNYIRPISYLTNITNIEINGDLEEIDPSQLETFRSWKIGIEMMICTKLSSNYIEFITDLLMALFKEEKSLRFLKLVESSDTQITNSFISKLLETQIPKKLLESVIKICISLGESVYQSVLLYCSNNNEATDSFIEYFSSIIKSVNEDIVQQITEFLTPNFNKYKSFDNLEIITSFAVAVRSLDDCTLKDLLETKFTKISKSSIFEIDPEGIKKVLSMSQPIMKMGKHTQIVEIDKFAERFFKSIVKKANICKEMHTDYFKIINDSMREREMNTKLQMTSDTRKSFHITPFSYPSCPRSYILSSPIRLDSIPSKKPDKICPSVGVFDIEPDPNIPMISPLLPLHEFTYSGVFSSPNILEMLTTSRGEFSKSYNVTFVRLDLRVPSIVFVYETRYLILMCAKMSDGEIELLDIPTDLLQGALLGELGSCTLFVGRPVVEITKDDIIMARPSINAAQKCHEVFTYTGGCFILVTDVMFIPEMKMSTSLSEITKVYIEGDLSNFEYISFVNFYAGRSYDSLETYPIFPRIIADFNLKKMRDTSLPIQICGDCEGQSKILRKRYISQHYHHPENVLNPITVSSFLIRLAPFCYHNWLINNGWDAGGRIFKDVGFQLAISKRTAYELTPELFCLSECLKNVNRFELNDGTKLDITLPSLIKSPERFIEFHRAELETSELSTWFDIIFGYKAVGQAAVEAINVFNPQPTKSAHQWCLSCGEAPAVMFDLPHPKRKGALDRDLKLELGKEYRGTMNGITFFRERGTIEFGSRSLKLVPRNADIFAVSRSLIFWACSDPTDLITVSRFTFSKGHATGMKVVRCLPFNGVKSIALSESAFLIVAANFEKTSIISFSNGAVVAEIDHGADFIAIIDEIFCILVVNQASLEMYDFSGAIIRSIDLEAKPTAFYATMKNDDLSGLIAYIGYGNGTVQKIMVIDGEFSIIEDVKISLFKVEKITERLRFTVFSRVKGFIPPDEGRIVVTDTIGLI